MKIWVILAWCYLTVGSFSRVNGQTNVCQTALASANNRDEIGVRRRADLLNIAHGNTRPTKCAFLRSAGLRGDCDGLLTSTCTAPVRAATIIGTEGAVRSAPSECNRAEPACDPSSLYRTIDGSCNNLEHPNWGRTGSQEKRLVANAYDDGRGSPRTKACRGGRLPNPRKVSNNIHKAGSKIKFESTLSLLVMQMGQFAVHDIVLTKVFTRVDGSPLRCCDSDKNHEQCNPIYIPNDDTFFTPGSCMEFSRSSSSLDCDSVRQVINSQSSYFDLSVVYGATDSEAAFLRSFDGGRLKHVQNKLPVDFSDSTCVLTRPFDPINNYCPIAGDGRVIEQPGLASLHTIFMREHNRLAEGLARINAHWDDERVYQEARKINIAQWQNIVYSEFLRTILGRTVMRKYKLNIPRYGYNDNYDPNVDATISNAFAVAGFRYGHSQVHNVIGKLKSTKQRLSRTAPLERHFFDPYWYHIDNGSGLEDILFWTTSTGCPFADRKIQDSIRQKLFLDDNGKSFDLATLNIHRGRDHGTPGYTAFRRFCGLSPITHFGTGRGGLVDHDRYTASLLRKTYSCVEDIDLFTGMMSERRSRGSLLGRTWQCIIASEFKKLRNGDRYFFERSNEAKGFTIAQLNAIKGITMSHVICDTTRARFMQSNAFLKPKYARRSKNRFRRCSSFKSVDLELWRERQY